MDPGSPLHREGMLGTRSHRSNGWILKSVPFVPLLTIETKTFDVLGLINYIFHFLIRIPGSRKESFLILLTKALRGWAPSLRTKEIRLCTLISSATIKNPLPDSIIVIRS